MSDNICKNCGQEGRHYVPPSLGESGFFACPKPTPAPLSEERLTDAELNEYLATNAAKSCTCDVGACEFHRRAVLAVATLQQQLEEARILVEHANNRLAGFNMVDEARETAQDRTLTAEATVQRLREALLGIRRIASGEQEGFTDDHDAIVEIDVQARIALRTPAGTEER